MARRRRLLMRLHLSQTELDLLRRGAMAPADLLAAVRHLAICSDCAALAGSRVDTAAAAVRELLDEDAIEHPDVESELFAFVDRTLPAGDRRRIEEHLNDCGRCREDVADLAALRPQVRRVPSRVVFASLAAAALIVVIGVSTLRQRPGSRAPEPPGTASRTAGSEAPGRIERHPAQPPQQPARYVDDDWAELVESALRSGIAMPATLRSLRPSADELRSAGSEAAPVSIWPAGVVVLDGAPAFRWPAVDGKAITYVVSVYAEDALEAESQPLSTNRWTPPSPLRRGVTYAWQVEVRGAQEPQVLPAPPQPQALFRVADAAVVAELEKARAHHPNDHLLLGVLYARAGLQAEAEAELRKDAGTHPEAHALAEAVKRWQ